MQKTKTYLNNVVDDELKYQDYKTCFFNRSYMRLEMNIIQSIDHNIETYRTNKIYLFCCGDKKNILEDG